MNELADLTCGLDFWKKRRNVMLRGRRGEGEKGRRGEGRYFRENSKSKRRVNELTSQATSKYLPGCPAAIPGVDRI